MAIFWVRETPHCLACGTCLAGRSPQGRCPGCGGRYAVSPGRWEAARERVFASHNPDRISTWIESVSSGGRANYAIVMILATIAVVGVIASTLKL